MSCLLVLSIVGGCTHQEFNRPMSSWVTDLFDSGEPYLAPGKSADEIRAERLSEVLAVWEAESQAAAGDYRIGPRDVIEVSVFALQSPDETARLERIVSQEGSITLPLVGPVSAAGLSAAEFEERVKMAYAGRYLMDPEVTVTVKEHRSVFVVLTGAVAKPGVYHLSGNSAMILSILGQAGGLAKGAGDELLIIRSEDSASPAFPATTARDPVTQPEGYGGANELPADLPATVAESRNQVIRVDLKQLIDEGNLLFNLELVNGDVVSVPVHSDDSVYVMGHVCGPRAVATRNGRIDAIHAVALAGGLSRLARSEKSFVVRVEDKGQKPKIVPVDLTKIVRGVRPPLFLQPGDTLVVGSSVVTRASEFIRPTANATASVAAPIP